MHGEVGAPLGLLGEEAAIEGGEGGGVTADRLEADLGRWIIRAPSVPERQRIEEL